MNGLYLNLTGFRDLVGSELWLRVIATASLCVILLVALNFGMIWSRRCACVA